MHEVLGSDFQRWKIKWKLYSIARKAALQLVVLGINL